MFVQLPDCVLQRLLLLLWQNVCELITGFEECIQNALVQLAEKFLQKYIFLKKILFVRLFIYSMLANHPIYRTVMTYGNINQDLMIIKFSHSVFLEQLLWVPSFRQTVLCQPENLLQLHPGLIEPLHEAAVGLHVLPPLRGLYYQGLDTQTGGPASLLTAGAEINGGKDTVEFCFRTDLRGGLQVGHSFLQKAHVQVLQRLAAVYYFLDGLVVLLYHGQTLLTALREGRQLLQGSSAERFVSRLLNREESSPAWARWTLALIWLPGISV